MGKLARHDASKITDVPSERLAFERAGPGR